MKLFVLCWLRGRQLLIARNNVNFGEFAQVICHAGKEYAEFVEIEFH